LAVAEEIVVVLVALAVEEKAVAEDKAEDKAANKAPDKAEAVSACHIDHIPAFD
jgi:hypothetical protein